MATSTIDPRPPESEVAYLFAFALGLVAGANAERRRSAKEKPDFDDLPQGFSLAGSKLDTLAGDALLRANSQWFLLEMKRGYGELRDEFEKPRVRYFRAALAPHAADGTLPPKIEKARSAHRFLYLQKSQGTPTPELVTLRYIEWLLNCDHPDKPHTYWKKRGQSFTSFLFNAGQTIDGFSRNELAVYIAILNKTEGAAGALTSEEAELRVAIAVDEAGIATLMTYGQLLRQLNLEHFREPPEADLPHEVDYPSPER